MPRPIEGRREISEATKSEPSEDSLRLARLRADHKFKAPLTAEQLGEQDDQVAETWQANHDAAIETLRAYNPDVLPRGYQPDRYRMRGGVIEEKLDKYVDYLLSHELEAYRSARSLWHYKVKQAELPLQELVATRLHATLVKRHKSRIIHSKQDIDELLRRRRKLDKYRQAFPHYKEGSSSSQQHDTAVPNVEGSSSSQQHDTAVSNVEGSEDARQGTLSQQGGEDYYKQASKVRFPSPEARSESSEAESEFGHEIGFEDDIQLFS